MKKQKIDGFTLIEVLLGIAIIGVLAALAVPSFQDMLERNRLKEAAEALKSDLQWARTEAIKQSCIINVSFDTSSWSYTIYRNAGACNCPSGGSNCNDRVINGANFSGIIMNSASFSSGTSTAFDFRRGTPTLAGNVRFGSTNRTVKVVVSPVGRVKICNISGNQGLSGYETC